MNLIGMQERRNCALRARLGLIGLDQVADVLRIFFTMTVTGDGIGAAGGFDHNFRPQDARGDVYRRHL